MKRVSVIIIMLSFVSLSLSAFALSDNQAQKIKDIKRSGKYFFFESFFDNENEARSTAVLSLTNKVNKALLESGMDNPKKVDVESIMKTKQEIVQFKNGIYDVFVYVPKSDFIKIRQDSVPERTSLSVSVANAAPSQNHTQSQNQTPSQHQTPSKNPETNEIISVTVANSDNMKEWQTELISQLLQKKNISEAVSFIDRNQASRKIKSFGTVAESKDAASSFWIIFDTDSQKTLIALLGPGQDLRLNYKTNTKVSLGDYSGKNAIWFIMAK